MTITYEISRDDGGGGSMILSELWNTLDKEIKSGIM